MPDIKGMPGINVHVMLKHQLDECPKCCKYFMENVGTIVGETAILTEEQVESLIVMLNDYHQKFHV
jgi:hypothetical protein